MTLAHPYGSYQTKSQGISICGIDRKHDLRCASKSTITQNIHKHYRQVSNISHTLVGNKIVDHSDVVGASLVGAAPTTFSFST